MHKDNLGMLFASFCIVHCLLTPILLVSGSIGIFSVILGNELFHQILVLPLVLLAFLSFPIAYCKHRSVLPSLIGFPAVCLMILALFSGDQWETILTLIGGVSLIAAHWSNRRLSLVTH